jgi:hypothetical protein
MPTGYTADIKDGITFEQFAMTCARAFGACIALRDEPMGTEIPEFEPSDYHAMAHQRAREELARLHVMTDAESEASALKAYLDECERRATRMRDQEALKANYEAMLSKVMAWTPPSKEHVGLRDFMREQIEQSIKFDCGYTEQPLQQQTGAVWLAERIATAERDIEYHAKEHAAEVARTAERNVWVRDLRASLATP